jgi:hypothetical protein
MASDEDRRSDAAEVLARKCVLEPDADAFNALLEDLPALADSVAAKVLKLAGAAPPKDIEVKKG